MIPRVYTQIYMVYMPKIAYFCSAVLRAAIAQTGVAVRCKTGQSTLIEIIKNCVHVRRSYPALQILYYQGVAVLETSYTAKKVCEHTISMTMSLCLFLYAWAMRIFQLVALCDLRIQHCLFSA